MMVSDIVADAEMGGKFLMRLFHLNSVCRLIVILPICVLLKVVPAQSGPQSGCSHSDQAWLETKIYLGLSKPGGAAVSKRQWDRFVADNFVISFPQGFTIIETTGYWQDRKTKATEYENGRQVIILHEATTANETAVNHIAERYRSQFDQQSVLISSSETRVRFCDGS